MRTSNMTHMHCTVCQGGVFEEVYAFKKLKIFSALRPAPFSEKFRFDARVYRCKRCGFVQQKLTPALERFLTDFYTKEESFFSAPPAADEEAPVERVASNIAFLRKYIRLPIRSILEIGCYDGYFLNAIAQKFNIQEVVGIEILRKKNKFPRIRMIHSPYPTNTVKGKEFDLIVIMNVLEHVFEPRMFMSALRENLSEKGHVLIEIPNEEWAFKTGMISYQHQHISYFTPATFKKFLGSLGFKIDALYTADHDRMLVVCSKAKKITAVTKGADLLSKNYGKRVKALTTRFKKIVASKEPIGLYGASTFTHNMVQVAGVPAKTQLFDGDERKAHKYLSDVKKEVLSYKEIDTSGVAKVLIMPLGFTKEIYRFLIAKKIKTPIEKLFKEE